MNDGMTEVSMQNVLEQYKLKYAEVCEENIMLRAYNKQLANENAQMYEQQAEFNERISEMNQRLEYLEEPSLEKTDDE